MVVLNFHKLTLLCHQKHEGAIKDNIIHVSSTLQEHHDPVYSDIAHKEKNHVYSDCKDNVISLMFSRKFEIIYAKGIALFEGSNQRGKLLLTKVQLKIELINQIFCSALF